MQKWQKEFKPSKSYQYEFAAHKNAFDEEIAEVIAERDYNFMWQFYISGLFELTYW